MKYGFIRTAAATPDIKVCDCDFNADNIIKNIKTAYENNTEIIVFPELVITGYTCGDLFGQRTLISSSMKALDKIKCETKNINTLIVLGMPYQYKGKLYNCGAVLYKGHILALISKSFLPNYNEFYEKRWFEEALNETVYVDILGDTVPFGTKIIVQAENIPEFSLAVEICEDLWSVIPPSSNHSLAGATIIANPSAGNEITGKDRYRLSLVSSQSAKTISSYIYTCAGYGESTTDVVFSGHNIICENGTVLATAKRFENGIVYGDIDIFKIASERQKNTSFRLNTTGYTYVNFEFEENNGEVNRFFDPHPFVPSDLQVRDKRCDEILNIQPARPASPVRHTARPALPGRSPVPPSHGSPARASGHGGGHVPPAVLPFLPSVTFSASALLLPAPAGGEIRPNLLRQQFPAFVPASTGDTVQYRWLTYWRRGWPRGCPGRCVPDRAGCPPAYSSHRCIVPQDGSIHSGPPR